MAIPGVLLRAAGGGALLRPIERPRRRPNMSAFELALAAANAANAQNIQKTRNVTNTLLSTESTTFAEGL